MSMGVRMRMSTMRMQMRTKKPHKLMMHQPSMWRAEGIVVESVKNGLYISDQ